MQLNLTDPRVLRRDYSSADHFPHLVLPNFIPLRIAQAIEAEFPREQEMPMVYSADKFPMEPGKMIMDLPDPEAYPSIHELLEYLAGDAFTHWVSEVVGESVFIDPECSGGFVHLAGKGCRLGVHLDGMVHKIHPNWIRVCTLVLYFNSYWRREWNGNLEFWSPPTADPYMVERQLKSIVPSIGKGVLISNGERSYHGFPRALSCPEGVIFRKCLVAHFYRCGEAEPNQRRASQFFLTPQCRDTPEIRRHLVERLRGGNNLRRT